MMDSTIFTIVLSLSILANTVNAGCPSMCKCSGSLISCKSQLLEGVPNFESLEMDAQTIDLSDNSIFSIFSTDFSFDGNENIEYIFLNNNHIVDIHEQAFSELNNVKEINLNTNSLDSVPPMFVANNLQLVSLDLSNNFFDLVTPEIYSESLEVLDLSSTKISTFEEANIKYLPNLKVINLSYNRINMIETSVFNNLPNLLAVDLTGNFWNCDQKTIDLFNFLTDKGLTDITEPVKCITEEGFYQDIYTSSGPVDIFSFSLEANESSAKPDEPMVDEISAEENIKQKQNINQEIDALEMKDLENSLEIDDQYVNDDELQDDNQEAANSADKQGSNTISLNKLFGNLIEENDDKIISEKKTDDDDDDDDDHDEEGEEEENNDEGNDDEEEDETKIDDKSLEEIILEKTGKHNAKDITDTDIIDAINQLLKDEENDEGNNDYGEEDYWENSEVKIEKSAEKKASIAGDGDKETKWDNEEALQQALDVIEEEHLKENKAASDDDSALEESAEIGNPDGVFKEDSYIVLLERDSPEESQYGISFRNNIISMLGIMAFVLTFITGILFGLYAIREAYTRRRRRELHGSTNVLINKLSQDLA